MRVGVIGGGIAGLAAAKSLSSQNHFVVVFEKELEVGGRACTKHYHSTLVDPALQVYTPRGMAIEKMLLDELDTEGLVQVTKPVFLRDGHRTMPGSPEKVRLCRYTYLKGNREFPKRLAEGLEVRLGYEVGSIVRKGKVFEVGNEEFDALIVTTPVIETRRLLQTARDNRTLQGAEFRPCLSVVLGVQKPLHDIPYSALLSVNRGSPLLWLGIETEKCPGRAPDGWTVFVAQLGPEFSRSNFDASESALAQVVGMRLARLFGPGFAQPDWVEVERYRDSQPERVVLFESANRDPRGIIVAGDWTLAGRAENAYQSGLMAVDYLLAGVDRSFT